VRGVVEFSLYEYRAGRANPIVCRTQIQVCRQRTSHQIMEFGVAKFLPPKRFGRLRDELARLCVLHNGRREPRRIVVGPDSTGRH